MFFSQWSDYGNDSVSNFGFEYENVFQNDYEIDFRCDYDNASGREFDIDTEIEPNICSLRYC
jgi:hypothetical protein